MAGERRAKGTIAKYKAQAEDFAKNKGHAARGRMGVIKEHDRAVGRRLRTDFDPLEMLTAALNAVGGPLVVASVDPSIRDTGWAIGTFDGQIVNIDRAGVCSIVESQRAPGLGSVSHMVVDVFEQIKGAHVLVFEHPVVYPTAHSENPNHLMPLVAVLGGLLCAKDWLVQLPYTPHEWKGDLPKEVHQARHLRKFPDTWIKNNLPDHNAADAALLLHWFASEVLGLDTTWSK